jgi:hypothetical protein
MMWLLAGWWVACCSCLSALQYWVRLAGCTVESLSAPFVVLPGHHKLAGSWCISAYE